ncbi:hypothetical protein X729_31090 [Mesorhizobium sp. L103C131B0]|nr:hypothetical protein X729_31090 [Mesorhizobium sp. L103C131B0]
MKFDHRDLAEVVEVVALGQRAPELRCVALKSRRMMPTERADQVLSGGHDLNEEARSYFLGPLKPNQNRLLAPQPP